MLAMTISNREEMAILESAEMWNCDPHILIDLIRITWWNTCFCSKCKFGYCICIHLFWVTGIIRQRSQVCWINWLCWFLTRLCIRSSCSLVPKVDWVARLLGWVLSQWVWASSIIGVSRLWLALLIILALACKLLRWISYILCQSFALCDLVKIWFWPLMCRRLLATFQASNWLITLIITLLNELIIWFLSSFNLTSLFVRSQWSNWLQLVISTFSHLVIPVSVNFMRLSSRGHPWLLWCLALASLMLLWGYGTLAILCTGCSVGTHDIVIGLNRSIDSN